MDGDYALALQLQAELLEHDDVSGHSKITSQTDKSSNQTTVNGTEMSLVDPFWETTDPNPDVRALFLQFNDRFFWGRLAGIEVRWSPRMTLCAGLCCYEGRGGLCSVRLSVPLLKLRPRKDLVETLLHEMIHAYLFVTDNNKDHDGHGPEFHKHMYRINAEAGTKISVYHNFHDEVDAYRQHWWRCNGPCQSRKPYFGYVKRAMNRAPSPRDTWWAGHQRSCGGTYTKIKEPENYGKKNQKKEDKDKAKSKEKPSGKNMDIRVFGGEGKSIGKPKSNNPFNSTGQVIGKPKSNIPSNSTGKPAPKPTATVTSGVLHRTNSDVGELYRTASEIVELDSDNNDEGFVAGAKTPSKSKVKGANKPVSQGGSAVFSNDRKKNSQKQNVIEFTDSEDDDYMSKLIEISDREKEKVFNKHKEAENDIEEEMDDKYGFDEIDFEPLDTKSDDLISEEKEKSPIHDIINDGKVDTDPNDVRAMLRKVWGEKQFSKVVSGNSHSASNYSESANGHFKVFEKLPLSDKDPFKNGSLSDKGSRSSSVKRPSTDNADPLFRKKQKTKRADNFVIHAAGGKETERKGDHSKSPAKITSPIENLFKKIRDKEVNESQSSSGSNCDTATSSGLNNVRGDNSNNSEQSTDSNYAPCPVCLKNVPASDINDHLDLCLTLQAIS